MTASVSQNSLVYNTAPTGLRHTRAPATALSAGPAPIRPVTWPLPPAPIRTKNVQLLSSVVPAAVRPSINMRLPVAVLVVILLSALTAEVEGGSNSPGGGRRRERGPRGHSGERGNEDCREETTAQPTTTEAATDATTTVCFLVVIGQPLYVVSNPTDYQLTALGRHRTVAVGFIPE